LVSSDGYWDDAFRAYATTEAELIDLVSRHHQEYFYPPSMSVFVDLEAKTVTVIEHHDQFDDESVYHIIPITKREDIP
jgi:hypothetical protein